MSELPCSTDLTGSPASPASPIAEFDRRPTVTINQARQLVGVSRRTIYNWMEAGKVEVRRTAGGNVRIVEASLWRPSGQPLRGR